MEIHGVLCRSMEFHGGLHGVSRISMQLHGTRGSLYMDFTRMLCWADIARLLNLENMLGFCA